MQFNNFLTFIFAALLGLFGIGMALPTNSDISPNLSVLEHRNDYLLICPTIASRTNASECWRRFHTFCQNNGYMYNEAASRMGNICNRSVCYCTSKPDTILPDFTEGWGGQSLESGEAPGNIELTVTASSNSHVSTTINTATTQIAKT